MGEIKFVLHHKEKKVLGIGSKKTEVQNRQLENGRERAFKVEHIVTAAKKLESSFQQSKLERERDIEREIEKERDLAENVFSLFCFCFCFCFCFYLFS